ncbi:Acg family FMN-binding oxidoreductase [Natrinema ejinorense]|uniref:Nitroreductase n=1 Tax=Natrinema ejinorense TaxID=373386 RepID=A0A2A5QUT8_9EURY|nr:nitroreductase family protein [Natrinema ejinorense]PCR90574.1 nitroreductase [Natrinema ejinorense]
MADTTTSPDPAEFPSAKPIAAQARFLLDYAILAPSSHNSQPWAFEVTENAIRVYADLSRQLTVADPDGRELFLSVGCAIENLLIAAERFGLEYTLEYVATDDTQPAGDDGLRHVATVGLDSGSSSPSETDSALFEAITDRHTNHRPFESTTVPEPLLARLERYANAAGLGLELVTDPAKRAEIAALQTSADERQFADPEYRAELGYWIGSGALGTKWLTARLSQLAVRHLDMGEREGRKNSTLVTSAPVIGVLTAASDDEAARLRAGQAFERIALTAASEGLAVHPMSQILEVGEFRDDLAALLALEEGSPLHLFRLGYAEPETTRTPRRPLEEVLR